MPFIAKGWFLKLFNVETCLKKFSLQTGVKSLYE